MYFCILYTTTAQKELLSQVATQRYGKNTQLLSKSQLLDDACYNIQSSLFIVFRTSMSDTIKHHSLLYIHRQYVATWCALGDIMG